LPKLVYSSANKRYFCAQIYRVVVLIIPHTVCSKWLSLSDLHCVCMGRSWPASDWHSS